MGACLPWLFSFLTLLAALLPAAWLAFGRCRSRRQWAWRCVLAANVELFAFLAGAWAFTSYYLRFLFPLLLLFAVVRAWRRTPAGGSVLKGGHSLEFWAILAFLPIVVLLNALSIGAHFSPGAAVELAFPLRSGTFYVLQGGGSPITNPFHWRNPRERFAIDLVKLNRLGGRAAGIVPGSQEDYASFGAVVTSPCDGVVAKARDGLPDSPPGRPDTEHPEGNFLVIACGGADILLAHLGRGSVLVRAGEAVRTGEPLGQVGCSGNASEPHLHLSVEREGVAVPVRFDGRNLALNDLVVN